MDALGKVVLTESIDRGGHFVRGGLLFLYKSVNIVLQSEL